MPGGPSRRHGRHGLLIHPAVQALNHRTTTDPSCTAGRVACHVRVRASRLSPGWCGWAARAAWTRTRAGTGSPARSRPGRPPTPLPAAPYRRGDRRGRPVRHPAGLLAPARRGPGQPSALGLRRGPAVPGQRRARGAPAPGGSRPGSPPLDPPDARPTARVRPRSRRHRAGPGGPRRHAARADAELLRLWAWEQLGVSRDRQCPRHHPQRGQHPSAPGPAAVA